MLQRPINEVSMVFTLNWLLYIESIQNDLKMEETLEKRKFWSPQVDLVFDRPSWLQKFDECILIPGYLQSILIDLTSKPRDLHKFLEDSLLFLQENKTENFSSRIDQTMLANYIKKAERSKKGDPIALPEIHAGNEQDFVTASRIVSGCVRNLLVFKLLKRTLPEEREIDRFLKVTINL